MEATQESSGWTIIPSMKIRPGWTKDKIKELIRHFVPEEGCTADGECVYDNGNSERCAAGAMIPDNLFPFVQEAKSASVQHPDILAAFPLNPEGMDILQSVHDDAAILGRTLPGPGPYGSSVPDALCDWIDEHLE